MNDAPKLRFYLSHIGIGMGLSALLMAAILWANPLDLGQLLLRSREAAITPLLEEIEAPLITRAPASPNPPS